MPIKKRLFYVGLVLSAVGLAFLISIPFSSKISKANPGVVSGSCPNCIYEACGETSPCTPNCSGKVCGPDGCPGGSCGSCTTPAYCDNGQCVTCPSGTKPHNECSGGSCVRVDSCGTDACTLGDDSVCCKDTHHECSGGKCVLVTTPGRDACTDNSECDICADKVYTDSEWDPSKPLDNPQWANSANGWCSGHSGERYDFCQGKDHISFVCSGGFWASNCRTDTSKKVVCPGGCTPWNCTAGGGCSGGSCTNTCSSGSCSDTDSDTDGGKNYDVAGTCNEPPPGGSSYSDKCEGNTLTEYYCEGDTCLSEEHPCPGACVTDEAGNGRCVACANPEIDYSNLKTYKAGNTNVAYTGLVPCGKKCSLVDVTVDSDGKYQSGGNPTEIPCQLCHIFVMIRGILDFVLLRLVPLIAVLLLTIGGIMFLTSMGNPGSMTKARQMLTAVVVGLVIVFAAWLIVNTIFMFAGLASWTGLEGGWFRINCDITLPTP